MDEYIYKWWECPFTRKYLTNYLSDQNNVSIVSYKQKKMHTILIKIIQNFKVIDCVQLM